MVSTCLSKFRVLGWRLAWPGALTLGVVTALLLGHHSESTAGGGDKELQQATVTVPPELAWVQPDAAVFATLRVAEVWNSAEGKILRERFPRAVENIDRELDRLVGLKPAEIDRLTFVMPDWSFLRGGGGGPREFKKDGGPVPAKEIPKEPPDVKKTPDLVEKKSCDAGAAVALAHQPDRDDYPHELWVATVTEPAALDRAVKRAKDEGTAETHKGKTYYLTRDGAVYAVNDRTLVRGNVKQIKRGIERTDRETKGSLVPALRLAKDKHQLVIGLHLDDKAAVDLFQEIDRMGRGMQRALAPLLKARAAAGFADMGKETRAEVQLFFRDGTQAKRGLLATEDGLALLRIHGLQEAMSWMERELDDAREAREEEEAMFALQVLEELELGLRKFHGNINGSLLQVQARAGTDFAVLAGKTKDLLKNRTADPAFQEAKKRRQSQNNLKQIGLALHSFHDSYKRFPPAAICDKDGKPLLSWRVAILPYIEQGPLYNQFKLDEAWDSPHNIKLLAQMPPQYAPVGVRTKEPGQTFYQGFVADPKLGAEFMTAWETKPQAGAMFNAAGTQIFTITDGTSNTLFVVEAGEAVPWTKPVDLPYDPRRPLPKLGGMFQDGYNLLLCDGSVFFAPRNALDEKTLRLLITRADGQPVPPVFDKLRQ